MKEREAEALAAIGRRSLLPRLIYLSLQNASVALKESPEANCCLSDTKTSSEMESLLERYAKILGYSLADAVKLIGEASQGSKSSEVSLMAALFICCFVWTGHMVLVYSNEGRSISLIISALLDLENFSLWQVFGSHLIDWLNLAVFCNAWKLTSTEYRLQGKEGCKYAGGWLVDSLLEKCILERIMPMDSWVDFLGKEIPLLVQLVTEPLAWHGLIIQSLLRVSLPSGKKKKKGGTVDQLSSPLLAAARDSAQLLCDTVEQAVKQLKDQIKKLEEENMGVPFSPTIKGQDGGPGRVMRVIESTVCSAKNAELGDRITGALKSWSSVDVSKKIVSGQRRMLAELLSICESNHKMLDTLRKRNS